MGSTPDGAPKPRGRIQRPSDRPLRRKKHEEALESHVRELAALAQLMLGAAWSDGEKVAVEIIAIAEQLKDFVETRSLPAYVSQVMDEFEPATFDPATACSELRIESYEDRMAVMKLLARVVSADRIIHPGEQAYLKKVAGAVGLDPESFTIKLKEP